MRKKRRNENGNPNLRVRRKKERKEWWKSEEGSEDSEGIRFERDEGNLHRVEKTKKKKR